MGTDETIGNFNTIWWYLKNIGNFSVHVIYLKLLSFILKLLNPYLLELETRIFMDELLGCPGSALK